MQAGRSTDAAVLRTNCGNHASVFYKFEVKGRQYEDVGSAGYGNAECHKLKPGDRIVVYYLPSNPDLNVPGEIKERWTNELASLALAVTVMPAIFVYIVWRNLRRYFPQVLNR